MLRILRSLIVFAEELALVDAAAEAVKRTAIFIALGMLVLLLALASAACGAAALWLWADSRVGPVKAPLVVAGAFIGVAAVLIGFMGLNGRSAKKARAARTAKAVEGLAQAPGRLITMAAQGFLSGLATRSNRVS